MVELVNKRAFHSATPTRWLVPPLVLNGRFLTQPVTGVQRVARALLAEFDTLAADGCLVPPRIVVPARAKLVDPPDLRCLKITRAGVLTGHAWEQIELPRIAGGDTLLCLGNTAPAARLKRGAHPTLVMVHDLSYRYMPDAYSRKFRLFYNAVVPVALRHSTHLITVSEAEKAAIQRHYPGRSRHPSFHALQNGGAGQALPRGAQTSRAPLGLYVGSLSKRKNAHGVLRIATALLRAHPNARFHIIGGTAASLQALALDVPSDVADRIKCLGQINDPAQIAAAYSTARFLLFPSYYEASPLPPIEAMDHGCPVLCSDIPSLRERCADAALYHAPDDHDAFVKTASQLLTDETFRAQRAALGQAHAKRFTWRTQAHALLRILEQPQ